LTWIEIPKGVATDLIEDNLHPTLVIAEDGKSFTIDPDGAGPEVAIVVPVGTTSTFATAVGDNSSFTHDPDGGGPSPGVLVWMPTISVDENGDLVWDKDGNGPIAADDPIPVGAASTQSSGTAYDPLSPPSSPPDTTGASKGDSITVQYPNGYIGIFTHNGTDWDATFCPCMDCGFILYSSQGDASEVNMRSADAGPGGGSTAGVGVFSVNGDRDTLTQTVTDGLPTGGDLISTITVISTPTAPPGAIPGDNIGTAGFAPPGTNLWPDEPGDTWGGNFANGDTVLRFSLNASFNGEVDVIVYDDDFATIAGAGSPTPDDPIEQVVSFNKAHAGGTIGGLGGNNTEGVYTFTVVKGTTLSVDMTLNMNWPDGGGGIGFYIGDVRIQEEDDCLWGELCTYADGTKILSNLESGAVIPKPWNFCQFTIDGESPEPPPTGYYASPSGGVDSAGTYEDPWDLRAALAGTTSTATLPVDGTLNLLSGTYNDPQPGTWLLNLDRVYSADIEGITVKAYVPPGVNDPGPVVVQGGITMNAEGITLQDIVFYNPDDVPGGEPTPAGSPFPNFPGQPGPPHDGFAKVDLTAYEWGAAGASPAESLGVVDGRIINTASIGGNSGYSAFETGPFEFYGNVAYGNGWIATDRAHGHNTYFQNDSNDPADKFVARHNFLSTHPKGRTIKGQFSLLAFATNPITQNFSFTDNATKGANRVESVSQYCRSIEFSRNVCEAIVLNNDGNSFGKSGQADEDISFVDNVFINGVKRVENRGWTSITASGTRVIKTDAAWGSAQIDDDGIAPIEEGTFIDISGGGGVDETRLWPNDYADNRAHVVILDFDGDGSVNVDLSSWADDGDRVVFFHYRSLLTKISTIDTTWVGTPISVPVVDQAGDDTDMFIVFKAS
jgi:hypothetical protein